MIRACRAASFALASLAIAMPALATPALVCRQVAERFRTMTGAPDLSEPLHALAAQPGSGVTIVPRSEGSAEQVLREHGAGAELLKDFSENGGGWLTHFAGSDDVLVDFVGGTASCHTLMALTLPANGVPSRITLPYSLGAKGDYCGAGVQVATIGGVDALFLEENGAFTQDATRGDIAISTLTSGTFAPPCDVVLKYALAFEASHAFCVAGIDCADVMRQAAALATRMQAGEKASQLQAGVVADAAGKESLAYQAMVALAPSLDGAFLPTFGAPEGGGYSAFGDAILLPIRLTDGHIYLARFGHAAMGWRESPDDLMAVYRRDGDRLVPTAGIAVTARRSRIVSAEVR